MNRPGFELDRATLVAFAQRWIITTLAVLVAANVVQGIDYDSMAGLLVASLLLGVLNAFLRPLLIFLALPLLIGTFGIFLLFINAGLFYFVGTVVKSFHVATFWAAFWGALVISLVSLTVNVLLGTRRSQIQFQRRRNRQPPPRPGDDGGGPVIDV